MTHKGSRPTNHQQICLRHNRLHAVLSIIFSGGVLAATVGGFFRPFSGGPEPLRAKMGSLFVSAVIIWAMVRVACRYDRLWLGFALAGGLLGLFEWSFPALVAPAVWVIRVGLLVLWSGATIISIWLTRSAFRSPPREPPTGAQHSG
jgi:hypothetical protein